jgi:hypothetical protein
MNNKIQRYQEFFKYDDMAWDMINSMDSLIKESDETNFKKIQNKVVSDLKLNFRFIGTFGVGIGAFYPIVESLMKNLGQNIDITSEVVVLSSICALTIVYLEEKKFKDEKEEQDLIDDSKSMLEELKMRGVGNGIIKKLVKSFHSIKNIFQTIGRHTGAIINGFIDMFAYTSLLIPVMNGILAVINKYELNIDTLTQNFIGLSIGVGTIIAKHGISLIASKLKDKFKINKKKIIDDIDTSDDVRKFGDVISGDDEKAELIKEQ